MVENFFFSFFCQEFYLRTISTCEGISALWTHSGSVCFGGGGRRGHPGGGRRQYDLSRKNVSIHTTETLLKPASAELSTTVANQLITTA